MKCQLLSSSDRDIKRAAQLIRQNKRVAFPTETVYGIGAPLSSLAAISNLFTTKERDLNKPMSAHICSLAQLPLLTDKVPELFFLLASHFLPGPLTIVIEKGRWLADQITASLPTIGIRWPSHPVAQKLIEYIGEPLIATSANLSGLSSSIDVIGLENTFGNRLDYIIDGGVTEYKIASTVISLEGNKIKILREGAILPQDLEKILDGQAIIC